MVGPGLLYLEDGILLMGAQVVGDALLRRLALDEGGPVKVGRGHLLGVHEHAPAALDLLLQVAAGPGRSGHDHEVVDTALGERVGEERVADTLRQVLVRVVALALDGAPVTPRGSLRHQVDAGVLRIVNGAVFPRQGLGKGAHTREVPGPEGVVVQIPDAGGLVLVALLLLGEAA